MLRAALKRSGIKHIMYGYMHTNLSALARGMRARVFEHMLKTRGWKYKSFLWYLRVFKYAAFAPTRGAFLESYYTLMRYLDDVVDGDAPLPAAYVDESEYIRAKIAFSANQARPSDEVDYLMLHCFELAAKMGEDFQQETKDILESLLFDAQRRGKMIVFSQEELQHHFHLLDIRGTVRATLKVFKDDPDKYVLLAPLGTACRCEYDLEDFEGDIAAGYVNISREELEALDIAPEALQDPSSPIFDKWRRYKAEEGLKLLDAHRHQLPKGHFSLLERATFALVYERPAKRLFNKILQEDDGRHGRRT